MSYNLLYITNQDPNGVGGGNYASHAFLKAFSSIFSGNIDLCINDLCKEQDSSIKTNHIYRVPKVSILRKILSPITGELHRYTRFVKKLTESTHYDYCILDHNKLAGTLIKHLKSKGIKIITIHHNYEPEYFIDNQRNALIRKLMLHHVVESEKLAYLESHYNLFLTNSDLNKFKQEYGMCTGKCSIIGVFEYNNYPDFQFSYSNNKEITIAITGSMDNEQGIDGIKYFLNDLYPSLPTNCKVVIAGKNPRNEIKKLCSKFNNVFLISNPPSMDEIIEQSNIYICPTRLGGGIKLRVMDGLRKGLPVITHSCSARGYDYFFKEEFFKIYSTPEQFSDALHEIISLIIHNNDYKSDIIKRYNNIFSYEAGLARLSQIFKQNLE